MIGAAAGLGLGLFTPPASGDTYPGVPDRWTPLVTCESGGVATAVNPNSGAAGYYQILGSTWAAFGGLRFAPTADEATARQQLIVAERILAGQGPGAWVCPGAPSRHTNVEGDSESVESSRAGAGRAGRGGHRDPGGVSGARVVVQPGDTLSGIAAARGTTWQTLWQLDQPGLASGDPDLIYPGDKVNVTGHPVQ